MLDLKGWLGGWFITLPLTLSAASWAGIKTGDWVPLGLASAILFGPPLISALAAPGSRKVSPARARRTRAWRTGTLISFGSLAVLAAWYVGTAEAMAPRDRTWFAAVSMLAGLVSLVPARPAARSGSAAAVAFVSGVTFTFVFSTGTLVWVYWFKDFPLYLVPDDESTVRALVALAVVFLIVSAFGASLAVLMIPGPALPNLLRTGIGFGVAFVVAMSSAHLSNQVLEDTDDRLFGGYLLALTVWFFGVVAASERDKKLLE